MPGFLTYEQAEAGLRQRRRADRLGPRPSPATATPVRLQAVTVAGDYFATFGVQPLLGRALRADESTAGSDKVVVLSEAFWRGTYGADKTILGRKLLLNGESYEVVGVMPRSFTSMLNRNTDLWVPLVFTPRQFNGSAGQRVPRLRPRDSRTA